MSQPQALYVIWAGITGAAATVAGEATHVEALRDWGIVLGGAALVVLAGRKLLSWWLDGLFRKWEGFEQMPASIHALDEKMAQAVGAMREEMGSSFQAMRRDMQTLTMNVETRNAADHEWKKAADAREAEARRRLNELERAVGWKVRGEPNGSS